jgi:hypothetical protein
VQVYDTGVLDGEALGLIALGYRKVFFAELYCITHGAIRIGLEVRPDEKEPCPRCRRLSRCSPALCIGFTRHTVPFWETVTNGRLISGLIRPDEPIISKPRRRRVSACGSNLVARMRARR